MRSTSRLCLTWCRQSIYLALTPALWFNKAHPQRLGVGLRGRVGHLRWQLPAALPARERTPLQSLVTSLGELESIMWCMNWSRVRSNKIGDHKNRVCPANKESFVSIVWRCLHRLEPLFWSGQGEGEADSTEMLMGFRQVRQKCTPGHSKSYLTVKMAEITSHTMAAHLGATRVQVGHRRGVPNAPISSYTPFAVSSPWQEANV